ncbi:ribonuclease H [candidate division TA06 bacterium]|uniref:Ribonuclease H n=1 Tax=candidate division TA06 bacterium TaxID=2250710 RepID=A0A660SCS8_UNCT6|nr:MAG: ribonuclease H [candidate division TA06 bacterium]
MKIKIYTDGASRGNPGEAGAGVIVKDFKDNLILSKYKYIGKATNNQAEYAALEIAIKEILKTFKERENLHMEFYLDSELVVKQMNGIYKVKNRSLIFYKFRIEKLLSSFKRYSFYHIARELNKEADKLANIAIDLKE